MPRMQGVRRATARRYACKKYDGRPVDPAALQAILEAGRLARMAVEDHPAYQGRGPVMDVLSVAPCEKPARITGRPSLQCSR